MLGASERSRVLAMRVRARTQDIAFDHRRSVAIQFGRIDANAKRLYTYIYIYIYVKSNDNALCVSTCSYMS